MKIGFIGQGYVGKNYADNYEGRGYEVIRYAINSPYEDNKELIKECDIVFIAVPTPTTPSGYDISIVESVIPLAKDGAIVVVKSTMPLKTTEMLAKKYSQFFIFYCPEFLSERTAREDVDKPHANIIGIGLDNDEFRNKAEEVLKTLPMATFSKVCLSLEAELIKYSRNIHGLYEVVFYNMFYDLAQSLQINYETLKEYFKHDPLHVYRYATPVHDSGHTLGKLGRGAGGHCFIKDYKAFLEFTEETLNDSKYRELLSAVEKVNLSLLVKSEKDIDLLKDVYGQDVIKTLAL